MIQSACTQAKTIKLKVILPLPLKVSKKLQIQVRKAEKKDQ